MATDVRSYNQLTDSEAKMLRDFALLHALSTSANSNTIVMIALSELLLAAKGKACKDICTGCKKGLKYQGGSHQHPITQPETHYSGTWFECKAEAIRNSNWGDLFEGKS